MNECVAELARMIEEASGFVVSPRAYGQLAGVAREQIAALKLSGFEEYLDLLSIPSESPEWRILLGRITVKDFVKHDHDQRIVGAPTGNVDLNQMPHSHGDNSFNDYTPHSHK